MSRILDLQELYTLPLDVIKGINREWRDGVKMYDTRWKNQDINQFIIYNYPELRSQFEWEQMTGNERMAKKYSHVDSSRPLEHFAGSYHSPGYDRDLDPFYED